MAESSKTIPSNLWGFEMRTINTGSATNYVLANTVQPIPEVEMGCTELLWTDRLPATVTEVAKETVHYSCVVNREGKKEDFECDYPKWIKVKRDNYKLIRGSAATESQEYEYTGNPDATEVRYLFHKGSGMYRKETIGWKRGFGDYPTGRTNYEQTSVFLGMRERYYDPSF